jgi:hypothetical protein
MDVKKRVAGKSGTRLVDELQLQAHTSQLTILPIILYSFVICGTLILLFSLFFYLIALEKRIVSHFTSV